MLSVIILFSCDQDSSCIDADDFGDVEREILTVNAVNKDDCLISLSAGGHKENYVGIKTENVANLDPKMVLKKCLTEDDALKDNTYDDTVHADDVLANLGDKENKQKNGCLAYNNESKILLCESYCENYCYKKSNSVNFKPSWIANTPRGKDSDFGVNITPGSQIFVSVKDGSINLDGGVTSSASGTSPISLTFSGLQIPNFIGSPFAVDAGASYDVNIESTVESATLLNATISDAKRIEILRKNFLVFTPYPAGYSSFSNVVPIKADSEAWKCEEGFPNEKNKIKCSFFDDIAGEDKYNTISTPTFNNRLSSRAFEVGTDGSNHQITNYGGFIRYNNDKINDVNFVDYLVPDGASSPLEIDNDAFYDQFIDIRSKDASSGAKTDIRCNKLTITLSVFDKKEPTKIHYQVQNLALSSSSYTTRNIPFYSDSKIKIIKISGPDICGVSIKKQKYLDIKMPISGFVQFQMKDLENYSYNDLKGAYEATSQSLQKAFMECPSDNYVTNFYVNKDGSNNFIGTGLGCNNGARTTINNGSQYIGGSSASPQNISDVGGFSKIQIIKNSSNYIDKIKFFPFNQSSPPTSIPSANFNCDTRNNCSEISCNGGKISGLKAQFDNSSIKALSVICLGNGIGISPNQNQNSCNIYGRIINSDGAKTIPPSSVPAGSNAIAINDAISKKAFIYNSEVIVSPLTAASVSLSISTIASHAVSDVYIGLNTYSDNLHADLTQTNCRAKLNIPTCSIGSTSCSIPLRVCDTANPPSCQVPTIDYSTLLPQSECSNSGQGSDGVVIDNNFGTGGGGGGNLEGSSGNASIGGKNGESYLNPEFSNAEALDNSDLLTGGIKLFNGATEISTTPSININNYEEQAVSYTFPAGVTTLTYKIRGGSGGNGGACNNAQATYAGGVGGKGDSFTGTLDFSQALARVPSRTLNFKIKIGIAGNEGKHCTFDTMLQPPNFSTNTSTGKFKGGNGGVTEPDSGSGGAGGSASYIALVRADEPDNLREDLLVIAGGGGGGNGAKKATFANTGVIGANASEIFVRSNQLKSNANGYKIGVIFSSSIPTLTNGYEYDYYEYDDPLTKTESTSEDPLKIINVNTSLVSPPNGIFVRKDQILRILPKTFEQLWNSKEGPKECGVGMIMKIIPRPAVLCLSGISEEVKNPTCLPNYATSTASISANGEANISTPTGADANSQKGCMDNADCGSSPILSSETTIPPNSFYCPDDVCSAITCSGGTATTARTCSPNPSLSSCDKTLSSANPDNTISALYKFTNATCLACRAKKIASALTAPVITVNQACYDFEQRADISVSRFLKKFNIASDSTQKNDLITANKITKASDFNDDKNFGNFESSESRNNNQYFKLKNKITTNKNGIFEGLIVNNNTDFKTLTLSSLSDNSGTTLGFKPTATYSKGRGLQMYLCKETDDASMDCSKEDLDVANIKTKYIDNNPALDYFEFNSQGKIEKKASPVNVNTCDAYSSSPSDNFICFKSDLGNDNEIKKYRLAFKIKDIYDNDYINNSGSYTVLIEKRGAKTSRAGGIVNGILEPIISNLDGAIDNPATAENEATDGIVKDFYLGIINNGLYKWIVSLTIVLALSFYGMGYLMGVNEMKNSEIVKILLKIGFIYLFTSTSGGWEWFNKFFVEFFKNGVDYITYSVAENFDQGNAQEIRARIISKNFYDKGILFKSVDNVIDLLLTGAVQKKILALLFSSIFGWIYFLILFYCLTTYIYAIANSMLLYITCQIVTSILFTLGPIFFIFLMFSVTKEMFDNWIKALIGFSLQQIFLIMTLALFNSFVISFLKLALGYRVCWSNILSLNLIITKISILNFWTVAGVNAPEGFSEDTPDQSFGSDQNMPSIYLFLYLMITISLMKKFIELFTNLAVSLSGGLKASTIGADANQFGQGMFKMASKSLESAYNKTVGRAVANVDNALFDSGSIAEQNRSKKRKQFMNDMKDRASLSLAGNDAVSKYKKEHALELSQMSNEERRGALENVRMAGMKEYAEDNKISSKKLDQLLNKSGLDYVGNNLFGAAYQAAKQSAFSGGNLFNSVNDKKVDNTSFSKNEVKEAFKDMNKEDRDKFIKQVEKGEVHVNKGKIERARSVAISAVKAPYKMASAIANPKDTLKSTASAIQSANPFKANRIKKEAIQQLQDSGRIDKFKTFVPIPNAVKNWARTDEEKKIIRDKMRDIAKVNGADIKKDKMTSQSVIKDLKSTNEYIGKVENSGGKKTLEANVAKVERFGARVANLFSKNDPKISEDNQKMMAEKFSALKTSGSAEIAMLKETKKDTLAKASERIDTTLRSKEEFKRFNILEKTKKSLEETGKISPEVRSEILKGGDNSLKEFINKGDLNYAGRAVNYISNLTPVKFASEAVGFAYKNTLGKIPAPPGAKTLGRVLKGAGKQMLEVGKNKKLEHVNNLIKGEIDQNPSLKGIVQTRQEFKTEMRDVDSKISSLEARSANIDKYDQARQINDKNIKTIEGYEKKGGGEKAGLTALSKLSSFSLVRPVARAVNSVFGKKVKYAPVLKDREKYKKALKSVKEFNKLETPAEFSKFVKKNEKILKTNSPSDQTS